MPNRPSPPTLMRRFLSVAKRQGVPFDDAWPAALHRTNFGGWGHSRADARVVVEETRWAWERAYHDEDVPGGPALATLAEMIGPSDDAGDVRAAKSQGVIVGTKAA